MKSERKKEGGEAVPSHDEALARALWRNDTAAAEAAIAAGADVNGYGRGDELHPPMLMIASMLGDKEGLALLLRHGANVNARDKQGFTSLIRIAQGGLSEDSTERARMLVAAGADVNAKTGTGRTALDYAAENAAGAVKDHAPREAGSHYDRNAPLAIVRLLLKAGAENEKKLTRVRIQRAEHGASGPGRG